jgi:Cerato-platanin
MRDGYAWMHFLINIRDPARAIRDVLAISRRSFSSAALSTSWWNSPDCGECCYLTNTATGVSVNITAVEITSSGFSITQKVFVQLNGGQVGHGVVDVVATKVSPSVCGL